MTRWTQTLLAGPLAAVLIGSVELEGQSVGLRGQVTWPSGADMIRVGGGEVLLRVERWPIVLSAAWQQGSEVRPFTFCSGLVPADAQCAPQATVLRSRLGNIGAGIALNGGSELWRVSALPRVLMVRVDNEWRSEITRDRLQRDGVMPGIAVDVQVSRRLSIGSPLSVVLGSQGSFISSNTTRCADCFEPSFDGGFRTFSAYAGLEYRLQ